MDLRDFIAEAMSRNREGILNVVKPLTEADLTWAPGPEANPIGFLLWHVARSEDSYFHTRIAKALQVWAGDGWFRRFGLPENETGNSWTAAQVLAFRVPSKQVLLDYMVAVRQSALQVLKGFDLARLGEQYRIRPDQPPRTLANVLQNVISHEAHHQGAIEYLVGLRRSAPVG